MTQLWKFETNSPPRAEVAAFENWARSVDRELEHGRRDWEAAEAERKAQEANELGQKQGFQVSEVVKG
jgi:hypothetical protein